MCSRSARSTVSTHSGSTEQLAPAELVFSDFAADRHLHERLGRAADGAAPVRLRRPPHGRRTARLPPFDLVLFLGVLYHSAHHLPLLSMLNRVTRLGGTMLLETTVDGAPDATVRLRWSENGKAKAVPTIDALRVMLAWTGWRRVTRFTDYRPGSSEAIVPLREDRRADRGRRPRAGRQSAPPPLPSARAYARADPAERVRPRREARRPATRRSRCSRTCAARTRSSPSSAPAPATSARASARSTSSPTCSSAS